MVADQGALAPEEVKETQVTSLEKGAPQESGARILGHLLRDEEPIFHVGRARDPG